MTEKGFFASICGFFAGLCSSDSDQSKSNVADASSSSDGLTGVERYIRNQTTMITKPPTGVEQYIQNQASAEQLTGVEQYIRNQG